MKKRFLASFGLLFISGTLVACSQTTSEVKNQSNETVSVAKKETDKNVFGLSEYLNNQESVMILRVLDRDQTGLHKDSSVDYAYYFEKGKLSLLNSRYIPLKDFVGLSATEAKNLIDDAYQKFLEEEEVTYSEKYEGEFNPEDYKQRNLEKDYIFNLVTDATGNTVVEQELYLTDFTSYEYGVAKSKGPTKVLSVLTESTTQVYDTIFQMFFARPRINGYETNAYYIILTANNDVDITFDNLDSGLPIDDAPVKK